MGELVTLAEAAQQLRISTRTARRWVRTGALTAALEPGRHGPHYLVSVAAIDALRETRAALDPPLADLVAESIQVSLSDTGRQLARAQQELWRATQELARTTAEMRRLREELVVTRRLLTADRAKWKRADA